VRPEPGAAPPAGQVLLAGHTTLRLGGPARRFAEAPDDAELIAQVRGADERGEPLLVLGGGSNLVIADEGFPGTVVRVATRGIRHEPGGESVLLIVAAGEDWDSVVAGAVADGLAGLECLAGIPGLTGATPIQNVGAYGQEVAETLVTVRAYDRSRRLVTELSHADCGFGYRTSAFKRSTQAVPGNLSAHASLAPGGTAPTHASLSPGGHSFPQSVPAPGRAPFPQPGPVTGRYIVLEVTFQLQRSALSAPVRYAELARALEISEGDRAPLGDVRSAVLALRRGKGMVLDPADPDTRSAGSFFTNPVLDLAAFAALERVVAATFGPGVQVPRFPAGPGRVKVPAAWLIERAGFAKGYPGGAAPDGPRISAKHTLALINPGGATTAGLLALAREIADGVRKAFGVDLAAEPVLVGADL
jgi:UDP-N-acetylmuramate dehydrogenase